MRKPMQLAGFLAILAAPLAVRGQEPPLPSRTQPAPTPPVIGTHQIDRFAAIEGVQQKLKADPKSLADWVILGELAHEVALDLPADQAARYFQMSRDAYEKALALDPNNPGLKAAVQFAKDQQSNASRFATSRDRATAAYLDARRRDLAATNYTPSVRTYGRASAPAVPATTTVPVPGTSTVTATLPANPVLPTTPTTAPVVPARTPVAPGTVPNPLTGTTTVSAPARPINPDPPDTPPTNPNATDPDPAVRNSRGADLDAANFGTQQIYTTPSYQMYYVPQGNPYTYNQFSSGYYVPSTELNPALLPMTLQRYGYQVLQKGPSPTSSAISGTNSGTTTPPPTNPR